MNHNVKIAIAKKVKKQACYCHDTMTSSFVDYEPKYEIFYIHCLKYFGCEITQNFCEMLDFLVAYPENLNRNIEDCIAAWDNELPSRTREEKRESSINVWNIISLILGFIIGLVVMNLIKNIF